MKKILYVIMSLVVGVVLASECYAKDEIKSFRDPDAPDVTYGVILVEFDSEDYKWKVEVEDEIKKRLEKKGVVKIVLGHDLFFPTRKYSDGQRNAIISSNGVDAVLKIILAERDVTKTIRVNQTVTQDGTVFRSTTPVISVSNLLNSYLSDRSLNKDVWFASLVGHNYPKELSKLLLKSGFVEGKKRTPKKRRHKTY